MLLSLALIFLSGMSLGWIFKKLRLPSFLGMLLTGVLLGPYALNLLDASILGISSELRRIALIIILTRAGLALKINDLIKIGRPAMLMCFLPSTFEIVGVVIIAPFILGISAIEAAIMGAVVAAVSPSVIVPRMLHLMETRYGTNKLIPQIIMTGTSVDGVYVIVLLTAFLGLAQGESVSAADFLQIPVSILLGLAAGAAAGSFLSVYFAKMQMRDTVKVVLMLSVAFLLVATEGGLKGKVPFSGLLAVMSIGPILLRKQPDLSKRLSLKFSKVWVAAEVLLFVLVGAAVDIHYALAAGTAAVVIIFGGLVFRMAAVSLCLVRTNLNAKERLFGMISYMPKATVQAAISSIPLSLGLPCGNIVLTVGVLAILITAPLGAFGVDSTYKRLLSSESSSPE